MDPRNNKVAEARQVEDVQKMNSIGIGWWGGRCIKIAEWYLQGFCECMNGICSRNGLPVFNALHGAYGNSGTIRQLFLGHSELVASFGYRVR